MTRRRLKWEVSLAAVSSFQAGKMGSRANTHRHFPAATTAVAHTRTTQNPRIHELGTEADDVTVIITQHRRVGATRTADGVVARGRRVVPQGSIPAAVVVEANAACLGGIGHCGEARSGRLALADLSADVVAPGRDSVAASR